MRRIADQSEHDVGVCIGVESGLLRRYNGSFIADKRIVELLFSTVLSTLSILCAIWMSTKIIYWIAKASELFPHHLRKTAFLFTCEVV